MEYRLWLGRWMVWRGKKLKSENLVPDIFIISFYFTFYKLSLTTWKPLCAVYKIMTSKWGPAFTSRPSNYVNNFCSPIWLPVIAFSSQIASIRWNVHRWCVSLKRSLSDMVGCQVLDVPVTRKVILCYVSVSDLHSEESQLKNKSATGSFVFLYHFSCVQWLLFSDFITLAVSHFPAPFKHTHKHTLITSHNSLKLQSVVCFKSVSLCECHPSVSELLDNK